MAYFFACISIPFLVRTLVLGFARIDPIRLRAPVLRVLQHKYDWGRVIRTGLLRC